MKRFMFVFLALLSTIAHAQLNPDYIRHPSSLPCGTNTFVQALGSASATQATCDGPFYYGTASGTNTYTSTVSPVPGSYITGRIYVITFTNANTSSATFNANSLGAKAIQFKGLALAGGEIAAGSTQELLYDGTQFQIAGERSSPVTTKGDIYTFGTADTRLGVGTNNYVLTPDSAQATGLKWQSLSAQIDAALGSTQGQILYRDASVWNVLAPGTVGQYLGTNGTSANPSWSQPSSTIGAGWVTAKDCDLTAESSQTFSSDTTYTFCGLTWTKVNSSADNVSMALTNGTGLVIQPKSTSNYNGTTRTAPYIYADLATIVGSAYYIDVPLRIWFYISADNIAANADNCGVYLDNLGTSTTIMQNEFNRSDSGGTKHVEIGGVYFGSSLVSTTATSPLDNTDRVMVISIPNGRWNATSSSFVAAYSSGWPALSSLIPKLRIIPASQTAATANDGVTGLPAKFVFTGLRAGSATALSCTFARWRVDYKIP